MTASPSPSNTPAFTVTPTVTALPIPESSNNITVKKVYIVDKYAINIPDDFAIQELSSRITTVPVYNFESSSGASFSIAALPYIISSSPVPGKCVASTDFDNGITSAPIFCEGLELTDLFTVPAGWTVKYGSVISDLSLACTMNSHCPVEVSPETRYSIEYVFVVPDKPHGTILEFFVGDAFRGPSSKIEGFEGLGSVLYDLIIPSLSTRNP